MLDIPSADQQHENKSMGSGGPHCCVIGVKKGIEGGRVVVVVGGGGGRGGAGGGGGHTVHPAIQTTRLFCLGRASPKMATPMIHSALATIV